MGSQTQSACQNKKCCSVLGDKWMIFLFPIITLTLFILGIAGYWLLQVVVLPLLFQVLPV